MKKTAEKFSTQNMLDEVSKAPQVDDALLVRMITTYYANYVDGCDPGRGLTLSEIKDMYRQSQDLISDFQGFCTFARKTSTPDEIPDQETVEAEFRTQLCAEKRPLWDTVQPVKYQLRMLGDVGATLMFVADIVHRRINPLPFENHFFGVDLGTGTGILLAAQDVLARRNGFDTKNLHGIELSHQVQETTGRFSQALMYTIHQGDTRAATSWEKIPNHTLTCITNENIPAANERMDREPFLQNMKLLWQKRHKHIHASTACIPEGLEIIKDPITCDTEVRYRGKKKNAFCAGTIDTHARQYEKAGFGDFYRHLIPDTIILEGKRIPLKHVSRLGAERLGDFGYRRGFMSRF